MNKYIDVKSHGDSVQPKDYKFNKIQQSPKISEIKDGMLAFDFNGQYIVDPTLDERGMYPVDPKKYYNLTDSEVKKIRKANLPILERDTDDYKEISGSKL